VRVPVDAISQSRLIIMSVVFKKKNSKMIRLEEAYVWQIVFSGHPFFFGGYYEGAFGS